MDYKRVIREYYEDLGKLSDISYNPLVVKERRMLSDIIGNRFKLDDKYIPDILGMIEGARRHSLNELANAFERLLVN